MADSGVYAELVGKYGLTEDQVQEAIAMVLSGTSFQRATGAAFAELTDNGLVVYGERGIGEIAQSERTRKSLYRLLRHNLETVLQDAATAGEYDFLKPLRGQVVNGRIESVTKDGTLVVAILINSGIFGETESGTHGFCPLAKQPPREREMYRLGETRMFLVEDVTAVRTMGGTSAVRLTLSRTASSLPVRLLQRELATIERVVCQKRVVGRISYIEADAHIPREIIIKVGKELGERIKVRYQPRDRKES